MKQKAKRLSPQMNLPLLNNPSIRKIVPEDKHEELTLVLTDLLLNAVQENSAQAFRGGRNESENYD
jgi:hypothetical protein